MSPLYPLCCLLIVLSSFLVIGFALISWNLQDDCGCGVTGDNLWGIPLLGESSHSYFSWQKILDYIGLDGAKLCDDKNSHFLKYFEKRRLDDDELLLRTYCSVYKLVAENIMWAVPEAPDTYRLSGWMSEFGAWVTSSVQVLDFEQALAALRRLPESVTVKSKAWMDKVINGDRDIDGWGITRNLLLAYIIWRMSGLIYHGQCKDWLSTGRTRGRSRMGVVSKDLMNTITSNYVVVELIKTCSNYYTFHLQSQSTNRSVYMKCLRSDAIKTAKSALSREERILKSMKHRNIIRVVDWIATGPAQCLGLEFAKHGNLKVALSNHPSDFRTVEKIAVFRQVVRAMAYLHRAGFAHLNINAQSIAVFQKWSLVKLSGFCQATKVSPKGVSPARILQISDSMPIPKHELCDPLKADIWALGALFLFILTGEQAKAGHAGPNYQKLSFALQDDPKHQQGIQSLMSGMLASDPRQRPSAPAILSHLEKLMK